MRRAIKGGSALSVTVVFAALAGADLAYGSTRGSGSMEQCVQRVLTSLARSNASEKQVGPEVLARCDGPLRARLAEAIRTGEASMCTSVESCLPTARERASFEATAAYRQLRGR
jgi:hypothetical protein